MYENGRDIGTGQNVANRCTNYYNEIHCNSYNLIVMLLTNLQYIFFTASVTTDVRETTVVQHIQYYAYILPGKIQ